jgi:hypothetical protein
LVAWTNVSGPLPPLKLWIVVTVCADEAIAVVAHKRNKAQALLPKLSLPGSAARSRNMGVPFNVSKKSASGMRIMLPTKLGCQDEIFRIIRDAADEKYS